MKLFEKINLLLALCVLQQCSAQGEPLLRIPQGFLRGLVSTDWLGGTYYSYQSIPYAKPPVGELRFRAPEPAEPWTGILDATPDLPRCLQQLSVVGQDIVGQEDCLLLSVYTPQPPKEAAARLRTVMVFVHGGSFVEGSGHRADYGPGFLVANDVVVVSINYRLGILAGFSIDDPELGVPGNAGMKDIVLTLKWVRDNVEYFGGDPNDVTVFGSSAGAAAVHLLVLSPLAKGLFQKAIFQSGAALASWTLGIRNSGIHLAEYLNIQTEDLTETLRTLRSLPGLTLVATQTNLTAQLQLVLEGISNPIVEKPSGEPAFLPDDPYNIIHSGNYNNVSILHGYSDNEGLFFGAFHLLEGFFINLDLYTFIPRDLNLERDSQEAAELVALISDFYFEGQPPSILNIQSTFQFYTDLLMSFPAYWSTLEHVATFNAPIYFYVFSALTQTRNTCKLLLGVVNLFPGATHCDELGYLFDGSFLLPVEPNTVEAEIVNRTVSYWTNFAKYGSPSPDSSVLDWKPVSESEFNYVDIGTFQSTARVDPDPRNLAFWKKIYDSYFVPQI